MGLDNTKVLYQLVSRSPTFFTLSVNGPELSFGALVRYIVFMLFLVDDIIITSGIARLRKFDQKRIQIF